MPVHSGALLSLPRRLQAALRCLNCRASAQLARRLPPRTEQALAEEGLTLRSRYVVARDQACGWLSGVLRHARSHSTSVRAPGS